MEKVDEAAENFDKGAFCACFASSCVHGPTSLEILPARPQSVHTRVPHVSGEGLHVGTSFIPPTLRVHSPRRPLLTRVHTGRRPPTAAGAARRALHVCARFKVVLARGRGYLFGKPRHVAWQGEPRPRFPAPRRAFSLPRHGRAAHGRAPEVEVAGPNCRAWARRWRAFRHRPAWDGQG